MLAMLLAETQLTAEQVLRAFHHDEPGLFLGSAFITVAIVCAGLCVIRRRLDALLLWLAVFAFVYGQRMVLQSTLLTLTLPDYGFLSQLRAAINPLVPIPAFFFFQATGMMGRRGKTATAALSVVFFCLSVATWMYGNSPTLHTVNNVIVINALLWVLFRAFRQGKGDRDFVVLRRGLLCFVLLALWDNITTVLSIQLEPFGFAIFLACLGYVAARRTLKRDEEYAEIQKELELARRIQLSLLPGEFPDSAAFKVAARYVPMTSVAGDLYDYVVADAKQVGLLIADVSGHGVPAALIASMVKMAASSQRPNAAHPALLLAGMNQALCGNTQGQYVTAAYVHLDAQSGELRYAAAGHPCMLLLRNGAITEVAENGLLLAAVNSVNYTDRSIAMEPGDRLLLYTDGILEARNTSGELFGEQSLFAELKKSAGRSPAEAADGIIASVQQWARSQDDDLTVLVCDYAGAA
jgi:sigma-B regulation protein RsbU (phosphoserine phosphatase)